MANSFSVDTIVAIATPPGKGGVGIIRLSGLQALTIAEKISLKTQFKPRYAQFANFYQTGQTLIDQGIVLYFNAPHSFTGEDVIEFQCHGGPVILDAMVKQCIDYGARMAKPGEFSERAFLNNKIDLAQAEAIADLIDSSSIEAAKNAIRSLQGEFSDKVHALVDQVIHLRLYVEAAIDFPEEEVDFLNDDNVRKQLSQIIQDNHVLIKQAQQGKVIQEGLRVVIAGKPNAGKSSLLNALTGTESAIVTDIEGTTRDILREQILIDGMPLHIIDTAGLRESDNLVEKIGIERAWQAIHDSDVIILVIDSNKTKITDLKTVWPEFTSQLKQQQPILVVANKADLSQQTARIDILPDGEKLIYLSAKQKQGLNLLKQCIKQIAGYTQQAEGGFTARRRHLQALEAAQAHLLNGQQQLLGAAAGELLAEDLRYCQQKLNEITGEFTADDLLGKIFSSFCIGK